MILKLVNIRFSNSQRSGAHEALYVWISQGVSGYGLHDMSFMFRTSYLGFHTLESYSTVILYSSCENSNQNYNLLHVQGNDLFVHRKLAFHSCRIAKLAGSTPVATYSSNRIEYDLAKNWPDFGREPLPETLWSPVSRANPLALIAISVDQWTPEMASTSE